ncbi:ATP-binding protein [Candidatus Sodalis endolongispinus]|uniref:ATP-binding protein n=1 Tax=Candidatus Sodalis endolongispinus TaxID=2812662 RepID=A0ABS5YEH1_9GAMM|nr:ATP-binding protein [Candidatus Sodalis endolongispinus]MBT9432974.1 ATP-binding protein [Candidatus Sodalis endolongispinus]
MLNTLTREEFFTALYQVVHPSTQVDHSNGLCGRQRELHLLEQALCAPGRHALVYGAAGIGKTSVAHTLATCHALRCPPVKISCEPGSTLLSVMKHAVTLGDSGHHRRYESLFGAHFSLAGSGIKFEKKTVEQPAVTAINDNAAVVTALDAWGERQRSPVWLIIDDVDRMVSGEQRQGFVTLFKQLADRACRVKMILVARGEHPGEIVGAEEGFSRHLLPVKLAPLTLESGYEFISRCLAAFGLLMVERLKWRLARACAGQPRKLHLVCESLLISAWERGGQHICCQ